MTTIYPGATWRPIPAPGRPRRSKGRAVIFHVAVSEGASLYNTFAASGNDSHLYVRRDGTVEQYIDLDLEAYASIAANASTISVETQGGVANPDGEPWTPQQLTTLAGIARWAHDTEGVPLTLMPNSLPASKGIGYHRLGIDPWRVPGGEVWSSSRGKLCPGAAKIAQVPTIIQLALNGADDMSAQAEQQIADIHTWLRGGDPKVDQLTVIAMMLKGQHAWGTPDDRLTDLWVLGQAILAGESTTAQPDPQALATAMVAAWPADFAKQVVAEMGKQLTPAAPAA